MSIIAKKIPCGNPEWTMFRFTFTKKDKEAGKFPVSAHPVPTEVADMFEEGDEYHEEEL